MTGGTAAAGRYVVEMPSGRREVQVAERSPGRYRVRVEGAEYDVGWRRALGQTHWWLEVAGRRHLVAAEPEGDRLGVTVGWSHLDVSVGLALPGGRRRSADRRGGPVEVRAPMPGLLVALEGAPGARVTAGQTLAVIEAMKMQMELRAPHSGTVREVRVQAGAEVTGGQVLLVIVPEADAGAPEADAGASEMGAGTDGGASAGHPREEAGRDG